MSRASRDSAYRVLSKHYSRVELTPVNNLSDLEELVSRMPDLVFLGVKFLLVNPTLGFQDPQKIWVSTFLDEHSVAYTGSNEAAHYLEINKPLAKQCVLDAGLQTSAFYVATQGQAPSSSNINLNYPVFIKPTNRCGGQGIDSNSVADNYEELLTKTQSIASCLQADSLIEEYLPGREFSVAILKHEYTDDYSVMPIELIAEPDKRGKSMLSRAVKTSNSEVVAEVTDSHIRHQISSLALDVFRTIGGRDYGRIDIRLDATGTPQFLEANLLPCLIDGYGSFPKACKLNLGLDYEVMIMRIVSLGFNRQNKVEEILEPELLDIPLILAQIPVS